MSQDLPFEGVTLSPDLLQFLSAWAQGHHSLCTQRALASPVLEQDRVRGRLSSVGSSQQPLRAQGGGWLSPRPDGPLSAETLPCAGSPQGQRTGS